MGESVISNALKHKTSVGQRAREVQGLTPTRAIRIALARAAGDLWELPLSVSSLRHDLVSGEDLPNRFDDDAMMLLLDGPDGVRGGMAIDRALLTSVTEVQTIGEVTERAPGTRPFTSTDAALFAPLVDSMLERMDVSLNGPDHDEAACERSEAAWVLGYRFGAKVERKRSLILALEGEEFHILRLEIDIAAGMRQGTMVLCLPVCEVDEDHPDPDPSTEPGEHADALSSVLTRLSATMPRFHLPLSRATSLKVGDSLPMAPDALQGIVLRASDGRSIARCTLGKIGDMRALRLHPRRGQNPASVAPSGEDDGFSPGLRAQGEEDADADRFVPHERDAKAPAKPVVDEAEALPDLPPLDFDTPFDVDDKAPLQDVGNANFE